MKTYLLCALLLPGLFLTAHAEEALPTIQIVAGDKKVALPDGAQAQVRQQVIDLLKSSNFHSGVADKYHIFTFQGVQQDYRDTVAAGEYLLMILSSAQKIGTVGGEVTATEVIVGLRGPAGKNIVFTVDEAGTIVSHAKYSGEIYLALKKTVAQSRP